MTAKELNRDIKRLLKEYKRLAELDSLNDYFDEINGLFRAEFLRLYHADKKVEYMNIKSWKIMYRINQRHRFVPFHMAWIEIAE